MNQSVQAIESFKYRRRMAYTLIRWLLKQDDIILPKITIYLNTHTLRNANSVPDQAVKIYYAIINVRHFSYDQVISKTNYGIEI